ncbi:MAG: hypothetical protein ACOC38_06660 [Promethearchaeia archaeon]
MHASRKTYNIADIILTLIGLAIQIWAIMLKTHPSVRVSDFAVIGFLIVIPGSVLLAYVNANRLFSVCSSIDHVIALLGLVGLIMVWVFYAPLTDLLFPRTIGISLLILDSLWVFMLGILIRRFHNVPTKADKKPTSD